MIDLSSEQIKNFRYERKFLLERASPKEAEQYLKVHPALFREIYQQRRVNNIYLDSYQFNSFADNVNGINQRAKYRIRWYGETFGAIKEPALEIKIKHNQHVGKISYPLKPFKLDDKTSQENIATAIKKSSLPKNIAFAVTNREIKLLNSYVRRYFLSADGLFRVTIDSGMIAYRLGPHQNHFLQQ